MVLMNDHSRIFFQINPPVNMKKQSVLAICMLFIFMQCWLLNSSSQSVSKKILQYQCLPCGYDCDKEVYDKPGMCSSCHMKLVDKSTVAIKNIRPDEICQYINHHPGIVLLDVRTKEEFDGKANPNFGGLKNAINIPVQELESRIASISNLKSKEILVFCSHSHRSPQATYLLMQNGFQNVKNMAGGMSVMHDESCKK